MRHVFIQRLSVGRALEVCSELIASGCAFKCSRQDSWIHLEIDETEQARSVIDRLFERKLKDFRVRLVVPSQATFEIELEAEDENDAVGQAHHQISERLVVPRHVEFDLAASCRSCVEELKL